MASSTIKASHDIESLTVTYAISASAKAITAFKYDDLVIINGYMTIASSTAVTSSTELFGVGDIALRGIGRLLLVNISTGDVVPCYISQNGHVYPNMSVTLNGAYSVIAGALMLN